MSELLNAFLKHTDEPQLFRRRVSIIVFIICLLTVILFIRLSYLQIHQYTFYNKLAQQNHEDLSLLAPPRGLIFDRYGTLLAYNKPQTNLLLFPNQVTNLPQVIEQLKKIVSIDTNHVSTLLHLPRRHFEPIVLRQFLSEEETARFALNRYSFPRIKVHTYWSRYYPLGSLFASVVGYVARVNAQERHAAQGFNYGVNDNIGKAGIEQYYETWLRGKQGYQQLRTNIGKKVLRTLKQASPIGGQHLYLTIDANLQRTVQNSIGTRTGSIVVMNPRNGEILALVNNPSFNPNDLSHALNIEGGQKLPIDRSISFYNRAINGYYPPGSIIKPFISVGALNLNLIEPEDIIYDSGRFQLSPKGKVYRNMHHLAWGNTNLRKAIAVSSDIYFYQLSLKMGVNHIAEILAQFGYGKRTEIDLPNEGSGLLPTRAWKQQIKGENWYLGDTLNTGIGQGFMLATPLQMAVATSTLSMEGKRWKPHVLLGWRAPGGKMHILPAEPLRALKGLPSMWQFIKSAMEAVVLEGSAQVPFQGVTYRVGAKTGTAQVFSLKPDQIYDPKTIAANLRDHSLFVAFAPLEKPEIVLAIVLENSTIPASYIARQILDGYFNQRANVTI